MKQNKIVKNTAWLVGIQVLRSLIGLVISMMTTRYLGPSNYGIIYYADSLVAFVSPLMYLGLSGIMVQEIVEDPDSDGEILGTAITMNLCSALVCSFGVVAYAAIANRGERETIIITALYCALLFGQAMELIKYWFQAKLLSKYYSLAFLGAYLAVSGYKIYLLISQKSIRWFAVTMALDLILLSVVLYIIFRRIGKKRFSFSAVRAKKLLKKGKYYILADMMVIIFAKTDQVMLKQMIGNAENGYYSAALNCFNTTSFVFAAVIVSFRPVIFENRKKNEELFGRSVRDLYSLVIYLAMAQSVAFSLFAGLIVRIMCGVDFAASADVLRLYCWCGTFSYIGSVRNIWILAEGKQRYIWRINMAGAFANVILNFTLIPYMGAMGAALASLLTQLFTNVIIGFIFKPIRENNRLMMASLNPAVVAGEVKKLLKNETND